MPISLEAIKEKKITVGIVGLGYVGFPLSLVFAEAGVTVIGFDIDESKISAIAQGQSYIHHINHGRLQRVRAAHKFSATSDYSKIAACQAIIICVPTPLDHHLEPDLRFVVETCESIAPHLQPHTLVSLESTTWPGTTDEVVLPILEREGKVKLNENLYLCFSPEREDPGNKSFGTSNIPKLVGGANAQSLELAVALYGLAIQEVVPLTSMRVAETAKLFENIFRSVNIALVNELKLICEPMGIDVWEVIRASATKPFGFMPFWPGPGLGGHCIPIDPFYLTWKAKEFGVQTRFIELAGEINRSMPRYVVNKVQDCLNHYEKSLKGSRILILGLAYKSDIDDMRESPSLELIKMMLEKGATVEYHDDHIPQIGMTREYSFLTGKKSVPLTSAYDCFVLATKHTYFSAENILSFQVPVIDTRNFLPKNPLVFSA
ncbi:MAG: UDP-N-acetyl-D-glucosamine dehydrogenase [Parachlamydia sp.]|nr:MAG: UDP-N-acetyl-D-glucosamine dehydrogenase [Parachlamydia sp.]